MKTLHAFTQFVVLLSLPLLLGGCGEKHEGVNRKELKGERGSLDLIYYLKGSDTPYTGKAFALYENEKKHSDQNYKDGKQVGLQTEWHDNG